MRKRWSKEENNFLKVNYIKKGLRWCEKGLNRTRAAIFHQAKLLKLTKQKRWKYSLPFCKQLAKKFDWLCLSEEYKNIIQKLKWQCKFNHIWEASLESVLYYKRGCPYCSSSVSKGEKTVRNIFEYLFDKPFPTKRPKWLINPKTGYRLELDGYNKELGIAFEYQGIQHYTNSGLKSIYRKACKKIQYRDEIKKKICKQKSIKLIIIKYFKPNEKFEIIFSKIVKRINVQSIKMEKSKIKNVPIDLLFKNINETAIETAKERADKKSLCFLGIKNLYKEYVLEWHGVHYKYWYTCRLCNHIWKITAHDIQQGHGCPKCAKNLKHTLNECKKFAEIKEGNCLSTEYSNNSTKMLWECKKGHQWKATFRDIFNIDSWCPFCSGRKKECPYTYQDTKKIVRNFGVKTAKEYHNLCKMIPDLFHHPNRYYKEWKSWGHFLDKQIGSKIKINLLNERSI